MPSQLPILIIGLGSTGADITTRLKRNFKDLHKAGVLSDKQHNFIRFLNITSEISPQKGVDPNIPSFPLTERALTTEQLYQRHNPGAIEEADFVTSGLKQWFPHDGENPERLRISDPTTGAGGMRIAGRFLLSGSFFHGHGRNILSALRNEMNAMAQIRGHIADTEPHNEAQVNANCVAIVFGILAGGTASGTFLDIPILIQRAFHENGMPAGFNSIQTVGAFLLADVCQVNANLGRDMILTQNINQAFSLAELSFIESVKGWQIAKNNWFNDWGRRASGFPIPEETLYSRFYLMGAKNSSGQSLRGREDYIRFISDWWTYLLGTSGQMEDILPRLVDLGAAASNDEFRSNRLCNMGMIRISGPRNFVELSLRKEISRRIETEILENQDTVRAEKILQQFLLKAGISQPEQFFKISEVPDLKVSETISKLQELEDEVSPFTDNLQSWSAKWINISGETPARVCLQQQSNLGKSILQSTVMEFLGVGNDQPITFGTLKRFLEDLQGLLEVHIGNLRETSASMEAKLFSQSHGFGATLSRLVADADFKGIFRKRFSGAEDLQTTIEQFRLDLRSCALQKVTLSYLELLLDEVKFHNLSRRLFKGRACSKKVVKNINSQWINSCADLRKGKGPNEASIINDPDAIHSSFVLPLLDRMVQGKDTTLLQHAIDTTMSNWSRPSDKRHEFQRYFKDLESAYRNEGLTRVEVAESAPSIEPILRSASEHLETGLVDAVKQIFDDELCKIDAWGALKTYTKAVMRNEKDRTEKEVLEAILKSVSSRLSPFPLIESADAPTEGGIHIIHSTAAMERCFQEFGIGDGAALLDRSLNVPQFISVHDMPLSSDIVVLWTDRGINPFRISSEIDYRNLLKNPDIAEVITQRWEFQWTDQRFPKWIKQWHTEYKSKRGRIPDFEG